MKKMAYTAPTTHSVNFAFIYWAFKKAVEYPEIPLEKFGLGRHREDVEIIPGLYALLDQEREQFSAQEENLQERQFSPKLDDSIEGLLKENAQMLGATFISNVVIPKADYSDIARIFAANHEIVDYFTTNIDNSYIVLEKVIGTENYRVRFRDVAMKWDRKSKYMPLQKAEKIYYQMIRAKVSEDKELGDNINTAVGQRMVPKISLLSSDESAEQERITSAVVGPYVFSYNGNPQTPNISSYSDPLEARFQARRAVQKPFFYRDRIVPATQQP